MNQFENEISERLLNELNKRGIKQHQLIALCEEVDMPVSQPDMSKIYGGKKLNLYCLCAICKALELSVDSLISGFDKKQENFLNTHDSVSLLSGRNKEFEAYEGKFYTYFLSTAVHEDKVIQGVLNVIEGASGYILELTLNTGERDIYGRVIEKNYKGRFLLTVSLGAAYFILKNEEIGELCMITLRHRSYSIKKVECRIGLCLTMSAGDVKEPVVHKMLIARNPIASEKLSEIKPWLKFVHENICIEKNRINQLVAELNEKLPGCGEQLSNMFRNVTSKEIYEISVEHLRNQLLLDRDQFIEVLSSIYSNASIQKNFRLTAADDIRMFEYLSKASLPLLSWKNISTSGGKI